MSGKNVMIVSESSDKSTENVIDWLYYYGVKIIRRNTDKDFFKFNIHISNELTKSNLGDYIIWNRRGYFPILPSDLRHTEWIPYLKGEQQPVLFAFEEIQSKNIIGSYYQEFSNNKILNLKKAINAGFLIPDTIVTNNKIDLFNFIDINKKYITKSLRYAPSLETKDFYYSGAGTVFFNMDEVSDHFAPSMIQEYIEKDFEIRVFFVDDLFFAMAIFSQNDEKTRVDFRNYNDIKPNRNIPFNLSSEILNKLKKFVNEINCDTGSIDLIMTPNNEIVFLEINPMGQYHWLSESCNYYIDKKIAELLIRKQQYE